jgi:membrane-associated phospholipid phosphatase
MKKLILFFLLISSFHSFAQDSVSVKQLRPLTRSGFDKQYFGSYFKDTRDILIAPVKWKASHWISLAAIGATTGVLFVYDDEIKRLSQKLRTPLTNDISRYGLEPWGKGTYSLPLMAGFYLHGLIWNNDRSKRVALLGVKAFVLTGAFTQAMKFAFQRHRPDATDNPYVFDSFGGNWKNESFFSGHTSTFFSIATIIACEYKDKRLIPPLVYTLAGIASLSRIHDNRHWASDVFVGAVVGYGIGKLIYSHNNWGIQISPVVSRNTTGLNVVIPLN